MANKILFEITVTDKGTLQVATKETEQLGTAVQKTGRNQKEAGKHAKNYYDTQAKGVIGTANSTKSFSKMSQTLGHGSSGVVGAYATLAANIFAVSAAFLALRSAAQTEQIMAGLEASGNRVGRTLTNVADGLVRVTDGAISAADALRSTAQASAAGFNSQQIERLGRAASDTSFALGRSMQDSLDRLSRGVIKLEPELLDELGIMTRLDEATSQYAAQLGRSASSLSQNERRQAFFNAALAEAEVKFGGLSEAAGNTRAYDRLAAQFMNVTHGILSLINTALIPLVNILNSSPSALLGVMILFASTLKNQLLPVLAEASIRAQRHAAATKQQAVHQQFLNTMTLTGIDRERSLAVARARSLKEIANSPKVYNEMRAKIVAGTSDVKDQERAVRSLEASVRSYERQIRGMDADDARVPHRQAMIAERQQQITAIKGLSQAEQIADARRLAAQEELIKQNNKVRSITRIAASERIAASALESASNLQIGKSIQQIGLATGGYASALKIARVGAEEAKKTSLTFFEGIRVGGFAAVNSLKAVGAAFLSFLPYLGLITVGIGLLQAAWEAMKSEEQKALERARANLENVLKNTEERVRNLVRLQQSSADAALRTRQALILQANAVQEIASSYMEVTRAERELEDARRRREQNAERVRRRQRPDTENIRTAIALQAGDPGIGGAMAIDQAREELNSYSESVYQALKANDRLLESRGGQALEDLRKIDSVLVDSILSNTTITSMQQLDNVIATIAERTARTAESVSALEGAFREANNALGEFYRSAANSTPYDNVIQKLNVLTDTMSEFQRQMRDFPTNVNFLQALQQVSPELERSFDLNLQKALQGVRQQDSIKQRLEEQLRITGTLTSYDQNRLSTARTFLEGQRNIGSEIARQVEAQRQEFLIAQKQNILIQGRVALLQTQIQQNTRIYAQTGEGELARVNAEERVRDLQAQNLRTQKGILEAAIARQRVLIEEEEARGRIAVQEEQRLLIQRRIFYWTERTYLMALRQGNVANVALEQANERERIALEAAERQFNPAQITERSRVAVEGARNQIRDLENSITSLNQQLQNLAAQNLTTEQKIAVLATRNNEILEERIRQIQDIRNVTEETSDIYRRLENLQSRRSSALGEELRIIRDTGSSGRRNAQEEFERGRQAITMLRRQINADRTRSDADQAAAGVALANLNEQQRILEENYSARLQSIEAVQMLAEAEKLMFDSRKEGLEWQQQGYEMLQKTVELQSELSNQTREISEIEERIALRRRGLEITSEGENAQRIRAASEAYRLAVEEAQVKRSLIALEFELLREQRRQLIEQLRLRQDFYGNDVNSAEYRQLQRSIEILNSVNIDELRNSALAVEDRRIERLRAESRLISMREGSSNSVTAMTEGLRRQREERRRQRDEDARTDRQRQAQQDRSIVAGSNEMSPERQAMLQRTRDIISANDRLVESLDRLNTTLRAEMQTETPSVTSNSITGATGDIYQRLSSFKQWVETNFSTVRGNLDQHGGRTGNRRAIDFNIGRGNVEWNSPQMRAIFNQIAAEATRRGLSTLWGPTGTQFNRRGVGGHEDHLHVDTYGSRAVQQTTQPIVRSIERSNEVITQGFDRVVAAIDNTPITPSNVTTLPSVVAANDNNLNSLLDSMSSQQDRLELLDYVDELTARTGVLRESLADLGPQGQIVLGIIAGMTAITGSVDYALKTLSDDSSKFHDKFAAVAGVVSASISMISSVITASANARTEAIDKEIAAEQKRDGKSADSVAKIQALEKKKDAIQRKAFNTNKKLMMANAVIGTAAGIAQALGSLPPPANIIMAGIIGALGAAQLAIIAGTSYQSSSANSSTTANPMGTLSIGRRGDSVDLAKNNPNAGGEIGYLRGARGRGTNASNYAVIGSAYGGDMPRGYGNTAFAIGEKGPEVIPPGLPLSVRPMNDNEINGRPVNAHFNITTLDSKGVEELLVDQRGNIISMLREAANASGDTFLEDVNVNVYTRPNVSRL